MINLVSVLETCGFASHKFMMVTKVESHSKPLDGKNTVKFEVRIEKTSNFSKEFLREEYYNTKKESLN